MEGAVRAKEVRRDSHGGRAGEEESCDDARVTTEETRAASARHPMMQGSDSRLDSSKFGNVRLTDRAPVSPHRLARTIGKCKGGDFGGGWLGSLYKMVQKCRR